jgi:hypothetical protein
VENRDAVGAMYDVLAGSLRSWTLWLLVAALLVLVLTLVWGRLGLVAGVRRGIAAAREQLRVRREARATQAAAEGTVVEGEPGEGARAEEPWTRRVAAWWRGFADGLDLPARTATMGTVVRDHFVAARWTGIAIGALVLLFWPAPTLSVLIWIGALVALYVGALEWLRSKAPAEVAPGAEVAPTVPPAVGGPALVPGDGNGPPVTPAVVVPIARPAPEEPLVPAQLTPQAITTLSGRLDLLVRLGAAHDSGVLTDDEFRREKERLLGV